MESSKRMIQEEQQQEKEKTDSQKNEQVNQDESGQKGEENKEIKPVKIEAKILRRATHAGSWYEKDSKKLNEELESYLKLADESVPKDAKIKALIGPHAGYRFSGPNAAWGYKNLIGRASQYKRIFLLGPSHKVYLDFAAQTACTHWETPLGDIAIDKKTVLELESQCDAKFTRIQTKYEENEHSLEMHLPYIRKIFGEKILLVPLMIGKIEMKDLHKYADVLLPYFQDEQTIFIVSSDFCHWGKRFDFVHQYPNEKLVFKSIQTLDRLAMDKIETQSSSEFKEYLDKTKNTICGSQPIMLLLAILEAAKAKSIFEAPKASALFQQEEKRIAAQLIELKATKENEKSKMLARFKQQKANIQLEPIPSQPQKLKELKDQEDKEYQAFKQQFRAAKKKITAIRDQAEASLVFETRYMKMKTKFVRYDQSSQVTDPDDSSVSYATSYTII